MDPRAPSSSQHARHMHDDPSLLESLAARLKAATAKLPSADARAAAARSAAAAGAPSTDSSSSSSSSTSPLLIADLVACCEALLPFFDHLGPVFHVARGELQGKVAAVASAGPPSTRLDALVREDVAAHRATAKGSATRSLHRLGGTLLFIKVLFERLLVSGGGLHHPPDGHEGAGGGDEGTFAGMVRRLSGAGAGGGGDPAGGCRPVTLREAASAAYEEALAPWHTMVVRGVVRAGMLTLPSREGFLSACGESEVTARHHAAAAVGAAARLLSELERLLSGIKMPGSDVWLWPG